MRLVDCYLNLFAFTAYLLKNARQGAQPEFESVKQDVRNLLDQAEVLRKENSLPRDDFQEATFAVCAWVDEAVLCSEWEHRDQWVHEQLQRKHFNTSNAGDEFFHRLTELGPDKAQVLEVYALCLAMGFTGRFFRKEDKYDLRDIRNHTIKQALGADFVSSDLAFPAAYGPGIAARKKPLFAASAVVKAVLFITPPLAAGFLYLAYLTLLGGSVSAFFQ